MWNAAVIALVLLYWSTISSALQEVAGEDGHEIAYLTELRTSMDQDGYSHFPNKLHFRLRRSSSTVDLTLSSNERDNENANVYVIHRDENGTYSFEIQNLHPERSVRLYQDRANAGSFAVRCLSETESACRRSLSGSLYLDGEPHTLEPHDVIAHDTDDVREYRYAIKKSPISHHTHSAPVDIPDEEPVRTKRQPTTSLWNIQQQIPGNKPFGVELLAVADYMIYLKFNEKVFKSQRQYQGQQYRPGQGDHISTMREIRYFISHVANGVDLRYGNIEAPDFSIYVKLAGILIADTPESSPWTTGRARNGASYGSKLEVVDSGAALKDFRDWLHSTKGLPSQADHGMLLTGYDIVSGSSAGTLGIAYMKGLCGSWRASLVESHGNLMQTIETATHELGHSLGARHDGDKNSCKSEEQYLMATYVGHRHDAIKLNPWRWSRCSADYFREFLKNLASNTNNCLANEAKPGNAAEFYYHTSKLPGQIYSLQEQCQLVHGENSFPCWNKFLISDVCQEFKCSTKPGSCKHQLASRGTSCGHQMWCIDGMCKYDQYAPMLQ